MKIKFCILFIGLLSIFLAGCIGEDGEPQGDQTAYQDIMVEREYFPDFEEAFGEDGERHTLTYLGTQFLGEEPVQLWAERYAAEDGSSSIYLWGMDGKSELIAEDISDKFTIGGYEWYLDREGCFYLINMRSESNLLRKLDPQGKELYKLDRTESFVWQLREICQAPDDKIYLMVNGPGKGYQLAEMNPDTGDVTVLDKLELDPAAAFGSGIYLGTGADGPAVCRYLDIREADVERGEMKDVLLFNGTSYTITGSGSGLLWEDIRDFRAAEKGCAELLRTDEYGRAAYVERLSLETVQRTQVVLCAPAVDGWLKRQIARFNQENGNYHVVIEELGLSDGTREAEYQEALEDYARRISVQVATGKGPDILVGNEVLGGGVQDMIEKGALENLRPHMDRTGILEDDYFPIAFNAWSRGEEIYGICVNPEISALEADRNIAGSEPDIEGMAEALLAFREKAVYLEGVDSQALLRLLLEGSESLWGMVDWEAGVCDFGGKLFADLLEVSRIYGDAPGNDSQRIAQNVDYIDFYDAASPLELEERGLALAGWMFDDGCHALAQDTPIAINFHSAQKEGAWEFLCFLLGDEAQEDVLLFPVKRDVFADWADRWLERIDREGLHSVAVSMENRITGEWEDVRIYRGEDDREFIETEKLPYFRKILEEARYLPVRPAPVLDIVCEEAKHYLNGSKTAEEVADIIENRVNLYLNERKAE